MSGNASGNPKFATLSSGLLARKGGARPAMRRPSAEMPHDHDVDLGWNDMGAEPDQSEVARRRREIAERLTAPQAAPQPNFTAEDETPPREEARQDEYGVIRPVVREMTLRQKKRGRAKPKENAAFTLRLDHDRHLKLRLACAIENVSAQKFVTDALDAMLDSMPELQALAERIESK